jgi:hypothetical protein
MSEWQDISTAKLGSVIDALCIDSDGKEVIFDGVELLDDEEPYAFDNDGDWYWPHENGMWLKSWRTPSGSD